jgi:chromosome partitioning protein
MKTIAISNRKGGVGKTTTAAALGDVLSNGGLSVLLIDLDSQGSLSLLTGVTGRGMAAALLDDEIGLADIVTEWRPNCWIAPTGQGLEDTEIALVNEIGRENILKSMLAGLGFDVVILDCSPSMGVLTLNALTAADGVLIPMRPSVLDLMGLGSQLETIKKIQKRVNPNLEIMGVLLTSYDDRRLLDREAADQVTAADLHLFTARIPAAVAVGEAPASNQSVVSYAPNSRPSLAYQELSKEVIKWLKRK